MPLLFSKLKDPLSLPERIILLFLALVPIWFGVLVEVRGAILQTRRTDFAVFARAAWAVRSGADVYSITDEKGLHYHYPPLLALLMAPLADPPPGVPRTASLPFAASVGLWYLFSVFVAFQSVHTLANALTDTSRPLATAIGPRWSRGWWMLRIIPLLVCLPYLGHALVIGQVNVLWMALTCWMAAALLRGRSFRAGFWLSAAICLKVIPAFLILFPLWKRDGRFLGGAMSGLIIGLVIIPVAFLGADRAWQTGQRWTEVMLLPAMGIGDNHTRDEELLGTWSTHNQAFAQILHKTIHIQSDPRPERISPWVQVSGLLLGVILTALTLLAYGTRPSGKPIDDVLCLCALCVNMLSLSPAGHPHYLLLLVPLVMALLARSWEFTAFVWAGPRLFVYLILGPIASAAPLIVQNEGICYDLGFPMLSALLFWSAACFEIRKSRLSAHGGNSITALTDPVAQASAA